MDYPVAFSPTWFSANVGARTMVVPTMPVWDERQWGGVGSFCEFPEPKSKYGIAEDAFFIARPAPMTRIIFEMYDMSEHERNPITDYDVSPKRNFKRRMSKFQRLGQREFFQALTTFGVGYRPALTPHGQGTVMDTRVGNLAIHRPVSPVTDTKFFAWVNRSGVYCDLGGQQGWKLMCAADLSLTIVDFLPDPCQQVTS